MTRRWHVQLGSHLRPKLRRRRGGNVEDAGDRDRRAAQGRQATSAARRAASESLHPPRAVEEAGDFLAEVGAEVGVGIVAVAVVGDAVEDLVAGDRPAAARGAAGDVAVDREVERAGARETSARRGRGKASACRPAGFRRRTVLRPDSRGRRRPAWLSVRRQSRCPRPPWPSSSPRWLRVTTAAPTSKFSLPVVRHCRVVSIHLAGKTPNGRWP